MIEVRSFKWPRRPTSLAMTHLLGEDEYGRWLGVIRGAQWRMADGSSEGVFVASFVQLVPDDTFWTSCFTIADPVIDVDIVLPVRWIDDALEQIDLELDVLGFVDGSVRVRDQDEFARVRAVWPMPEDVAARAEETCEQLRQMVEQRAEPFGDVGRARLSRFLTEIGETGA